MRLNCQSSNSLNRITIKTTPKKSNSASGFKLLVKAEWNNLLAAIIFFTRIPLGKLAPQESNSQLLLLKYFPLIGLVVGGSCAIIFYLSAQIWPITIAVILSTAFGILLTGALHEDGFADSCDAFGGGWDKKQVLSIMKDSNIGAYGAIGLIMMLMAKVLLLIELAKIDTLLVVAALIAAHLGSRFLTLLIPYRLDYVQQQAISKSSAVVKQRMSLGVILFCSSFVLIPLAAYCTVYLDFRPIMVLACAAISTLLLGLYYKKRIGGYSGDCLGATQQINETVIYLALLALCASA